jgi:hypothetical protein
VAHPQEVRRVSENAAANVQTAMKPDFAPWAVVPITEY